MTEQSNNPNPAPKQEEFHVRGEDLIAKIKEIIKEGNIRRIIVKNEEGKVMVEVPLTLGVVGFMLLPVWAALGAIAALAANLTIVVEKDVTPAPTEPAEPVKEIKIGVKAE